MFADDSGIGVTIPSTALGTVIAGNVAMLALLGWIIKVLIGTTIPNMGKSYALALDVQRETFERILKTEQELTAKQASDRQTIYQTQLDQIRAYAKEDRETYVAELRISRELFERKMISEREFFRESLKELIADNRVNRDVFLGAIQASAVTALSLCESSQPECPKKTGGKS